jgi:ABC-2 type transport system ATP-binding protein
MLTLENVSKSINGKQILKNISFGVEKGQIFGYLGPNGAGKTTTIRIILGLYEQFTGQMKFNGNSSIINQKKYLGFMLEDDGLYGNLTLLENLKFYSDIYKLDFQKVRKTIDDLLLKFDLSAVKDNKVSTFSQGMKQKTSFIRAIIHDPKLLILDEPFNGLDPDMQGALRDHLLYLLKEKGITIFFSSHNLYEVDRLCDKIAIIKDGEIKLEEYVHNLKIQLKDEEYNLEKIYFNYTNE